jgi:hypothetical protein
MTRIPIYPHTHRGTHYQRSPPPQQHTSQPDHPTSTGLRGIQNPSPTCLAATTTTNTQSTTSPHSYPAIRTSTKHPQIPHNQHRTQNSSPTTPSPEPHPFCPNSTTINQHHHMNPTNTRTSIRSQSPLGTRTSHINTHKQ